MPRRSKARMRRASDLHAEKLLGGGKFPCRLLQVAAGKRDRIAAESEARRPMAPLM